MADLASVDPRVHEGICGHTTTGALGIEWVCIRPPHQVAYQRRGKAYPEPSGNPQGQRHYMVVRYPNRPSVKES